MEKIETGVDKLVDIVAERKKISVEDAAKQLGVSTVVVQEWADFLEEEGAISLEYSLSKVYLVERKLSKKEVQKKEKDYSSKKDAFVRKVETTVQTLDKETEEFKLLHKDFTQLKDAIDSNIEDVKEKMKQLSHYEELKDKLDVVILKQKQKFDKLVEESHEQIKHEEQKYSELIKGVGIEVQSLQGHQQRVAQIENTEHAVKERMEALAIILKDLQDKTRGEEEYANRTEQHIKQMADLGAKIEEDLRTKREKTLNPLIKLSEEHAEKITHIQEDVLSKIKKKQDEISSQAGVDIQASERFKKFFDRKSQLDALFKQIEDERTGLKKELIDLMNKATAFNLIQKGATVKAQVNELEKTYSEVEKKKNGLKDKITKLHAFLQH
ncbi:MAG: hypothetical protein ABIA93_00500 [Candidatus Woesearchaeota archaeon]